MTLAYSRDGATVTVSCIRENRTCSLTRGLSRKADPTLLRQILDKLDMNNLIGEIMGLLNGNGGGNEYSAQGGASVSNTEQLAEAVEKAD